MFNNMLFKTFVLGGFEVRNYGHMRVYLLSLFGYQKVLISFYASSFPPIQIAIL
jgi:hypothetical protein